MNRVTLYGIANCDTIRKARSWLDANGIDFDFHDYRRQGLEPERLERFVERLGWEALLNRRGTSWRQLPEQIRENIDRDTALQAMLDNPALIKRPLLEIGDRLHLGYSEQRYREIFG